jgi:8-oxo-dGTP pyrophosphatase MutT (NUDIX family)
LHAQPIAEVFRQLMILIIVGPEVLLQKQFRPPLDKVVIEVPAGLVDAGETAEEAAVRELKEETGYVGTVSETSPVMFNGTITSLPFENNY